MRTQIQPKPGFYQHLTAQQVTDLVESLVKHQELPRQYGYVGTGAQDWDQQATGELFLARTRLLDANRSYLSELISRHERWDVIDLGAGNGWPARQILSWLMDAGRMGRYAATDISADMLQIAERNIGTWFDGQIPYEGHIIDLARQRLTDHIGHDGYTARLVLHFGNTLFNLRDCDQAFRMVRGSMTADDFLIQDRYIETPQDFLARVADNVDSAPRLPPTQRFLVDLLGINEDLYTIETGYDPLRGERFKRIRLTTSASIHFDTGPVVDLDEGESLLLNRDPIYRPVELLAKLGEHGFTTIHTFQSDDDKRPLLLTVSVAA
ncbi:L-histidine N(alpha)-methyltransferase [Nocardia flavorosea]|uniref:Histidine-specific methyltransferase SAM-dependent domain-containing protein n=1 Tax=Nocardia flavorosea TaxID=53429 RepID=A0A846YM34_9NOCA|nr:L-histidine N(alpha)-methyltransferase [Nocardia flavorosea]NKY58298.1 hypothetical protein [Nocardia flavorosea]